MKPEEAARAGATAARRATGSRSAHNATDPRVMRAAVEARGAREGVGPGLTARAA